MRLTNILIEVGGFAATGSSASDPGNLLITVSTASVADGLKTMDSHVFAFGSYLNAGTNFHHNMFGSSNSAKIQSSGAPADRKITFQGWLSAIDSYPGEGISSVQRANLLFIAETNRER